MNKKDFGGKKKKDVGKSLQTSIEAGGPMWESYFTAFSEISPGI